MADQQVANLSVQFGIDVKELQAGMRALAKTLNKLSRQLGEVSDNMSSVAPQMDKGEKAVKGFGKVTFRTTQQIEDQIKEIEKLEAAHRQDAVATRDLAMQKQALQSQLEGTTQGLNKQADAAHRGNLFMINLSRGLEDLKFGLPAVINNLDSIAIGFEAMAENADRAGMKLRDVIKQSIFSPAGMLAIMNLIITLGFLLGPTLKKAFNKGMVGAKALKQAVGDLFETPAGFGETGFFAPADLAAAEKFMEVIGAEAKVAKTEMREAFGSLSGFGAKWGLQIREFAGWNDDHQTSALRNYEIYTALETEAEKVRVQLEAQAEAARVMASHLKAIAPEGSMNDLNRRISIQRELFESTGTEVAGYTAILEMAAWRIRDLENGAAKLEIIMAGAPNSIARTAAAADYFAKMAEEAGTAEERARYRALAFSRTLEVDLITALEETGDALKTFRMESLLTLGDSVVGGAFEGFFKGLGKGDPDKLRLGIIDLNKEFMSLEEQLAQGKISYEEWALKQKIVDEELAESKRALAHATQKWYFDVQDTVENAFKGMARAVKNALREIAQEYTKLIVRRGIQRFIMSAATGGGGFFGSLLFPGGGNAVPGGAITNLTSGMARISIAPQAQVIPSGDLQISLRRADQTSFRTGV